jgi:hypothetical protein
MFLLHESRDKKYDTRVTEVEVQCADTAWFLSQRSLIGESYNWISSHMATIPVVRKAELLYRKATVVFMVIYFEWITVPKHVTMNLTFNFSKHDHFWGSH